MFRAGGRHIFACLRPRCTVWFQPDYTSHYPVSPSRLFTSSIRAHLTGYGDLLRRHSAFQPRDDTIYALSTAEGKAGIAVIRISGPSCKSFGEIYHGLCPGQRPLKPRYAGVRTLYHPESSSSEVLDSAALVIFFPCPQTVTGDDVLELHVHGGGATVKAILSAIPKCTSDGLIRYAEPGEFTKRAFLNGRLDLGQVEALGDILAAETEQQRRAAVRGSSGSLGRTYDGWRQKLLEARAEMEALIDFSEDQHFDETPNALISNVTTQVEEILRSIRLHEGASERNELLRSGIKIALVGPPNVGKSSLMNQIVGREASIVSGESGTTRDIVEANLDIRGYLCTFADTAGFRTTVGVDPRGGPGARIGAVEEEGIRRARIKATQSDVIIVLTSIETDSSGKPQIRYDLETLKLAAECGERLVVINKRDAVSGGELLVLTRQFSDHVLGAVKGLEAVQPVLISCKEALGQGCDGPDPGGIRVVVDRLVASFQSMTSLPVALQDLHGVTERQRQLLVQCRGHLEDYVESVGGPEAGMEGCAPEEAPSHGVDITVAAEHLRYAANSLGRITGRGEAGDVEEILGVIFEKFCVGK
ncbi:hypothetical protein GGS23DRAFT_433019 [Durotheca rogersii]|uniref:uncharacterized protein n=1 Tax=Durotheca rogersii TaxID=419775 RepID=UPI0022200208|nr:uncharacterized protein GGS23DRAFT_433019 [Durotheca rogersii]KAI5865560.1 hypothetical protein GGS23DRAFT_433019 [Durotheca rogersii]